MTARKENPLDQTVLRARYLFAGIAYALEDAAAGYSTVRISFAADGQRLPEYLAINPKGRVPALVKTILLPEKRWDGFCPKRCGSPGIGR